MYSHHVNLCVLICIVKVTSKKEKVVNPNSIISLSIDPQQ